MIDLERVYIEHSGQGAGYSVTMRIFPESSTAVVVLSNLRYINIENLGELAYDAVVNDAFNSRSFDLHEMTDAGFTVLCVVGIVYLALFVRLVLKVRKRLRNGEEITVNTSTISIKGTVGSLILSIAGLVFYYYIFPYVILNTTRASLLRNWPVSFAVAAVAIWIMLIYDVFAWFSKNCIHPK